MLSNVYKREAISLLSGSPPLWEESLKKLKTAIVISPLRADLHLTIGKLWMKLAITYNNPEYRIKAFDRAEIAFCKAVALNSGESIYKKALATLFLAKRDYKKALVLINEALLLDPCSVEMANDKAIILEKLGRLDEAVSVLQLVLSSDQSFIGVNKYSYRPVVLMLVDLLKKLNLDLEAKSVYNNYKILLNFEKTKR